MTNHVYFALLKTSVENYNIHLSPFVVSHENKQIGAAQKCTMLLCIKINFVELFHPILLKSNYLKNTT